MAFTKVKICCISSVDEARLAVKYGASAVGLVAAMPSGPGVISDHLIREIALDIPPGVSSFLLTSRMSAPDILFHHQNTLTNTIQLVDYLPPDDEYRKLKHDLKSVKLVQVIHVNTEKDIDLALSYADIADALLLDSGNPHAAVKTLGGTGNIHNWEISRKIVEQSTKPVFLAGGLNAANVRQAIETVQPYGVDLCSGVRTNGRLDEKKLDAFFKEIFYTD